MARSSALRARKHLALLQLLYAELQTCLAAQKKSCLLRLRHDSEGAFQIRTWMKLRLNFAQSLEPNARQACVGKLQALGLKDSRPEVWRLQGLKTEDH